MGQPQQARFGDAQAAADLIRIRPHYALTACLFLLLLWSGIAPAQTLDPTFNPTDVGFGFGDGANNTVNSLALQADGKVLIGGFFTTYNGTGRNRLARLNADGSLDAGFDPGTGSNGTVLSIAIQADGKVLIGGQFTQFNGIGRNRIARLNADGSLDTGFDPGTGANNVVNSIALQADGKVLIGGNFTDYNGTTRNYIARLNVDGSLDTGFDPGTGPNNVVNSIAIQADGKVLIGGTFTTYNGISRNRIARLNADGSLDTGFDPGTGPNNAVNSIAIQADGKVLIGGTFITYNGISRNRVARLNTDGSLDTGFNPGTGANNVVNSIVVQPDGRVLIGGSFTTYSGTVRNRIARLNTDGTLDTGFDPDAGSNNTVNSNSIVLQPDGKVLIGGFFTAYNNTTRNRVARLNADGSLDTGFNPGTGANGTVSSIAIQADGKVLIGGAFTTYNGVSRNRIARLNADGSLDMSFDSETGANNTVTSIALQADGKVLIGGAFGTYNGTSRIRVARLNADGSLDTDFDPGTGANNVVNSIALQADGKVLIGGIFTIYNSVSRNRVARLNVDGSLDTSFDPGTGANNAVNSIALQADGKVLIGGAFTNYNGTGRNRVARLNTDGSLDTGFDPGTGANGNVQSVVIQPDGKVLIGGLFSQYNGTGRNRIARLNADGSLDTGFNPGTGANNVVNSIVVQPDGKVLIGGTFGTYNGTGRIRVARLNADGSLDTGFDPGTGANNTVNSLALQADGKILIGGDFIAYAGRGRNRIARLTLPPCGAVVFVTQAGAGTGDGSSWANALAGTDLQAAINTASGCGAQVWVAAGLYMPSTENDRTVSFSMRNGVSIYGGFAGNETDLSQRPVTNPVTGSPSSSTLSGDIDNTPGDNTGNSYHIISNPTSLSLNNTAVLDGFVITGGNADGNGSLLQNIGAGMLNAGDGSGNSCSPTVRNCLFENNTAFSGGAMYNNGYQGVSSPVLTNCLFQTNMATNSDGGAINNNGYEGVSRPVLTNCSFQSNSAINGSAGAMYNNGSRGVSSPVLTNCSFQDNTARYTGGAVYNYGFLNGNSSPRLTNCLFQNNSAINGGGMVNYGASGTSVPVLVNCSFEHNSASSYGGAMYNYGASGNSSPRLTNCSFQSNSATLQGGAAYNYEQSAGASNLVLTNCVVFDNGGANTFYIANNARVTATYSLFDASVTNYLNGAGGNNIVTSISPFASTTSAALKSCAPAINTGRNQDYTTANGPATDLTGNSRFYQSGVIDMGAYEFQESPTPQTGITAQPASGSAGCPGGTVTAFVSASGTSPFTYQWYKDNLNSPVSNQTSATLTLSNLQTSDAGSYSVVVTGYCNAVTSTAFSLSVNTPSATLSSGTLTCAQTSVTLTASSAGGTSYTLSDGQSNTTGEFVVSTPGGYTVTVASAGGCSATATSSVASNTVSPTNASLTSGTLTCTQTSTQLTASATGGTSYTLSDGQTNTTGEFTVSQVGNYTVTISNANGCTAMATATVESNATPPTNASLTSGTLTCTQTSVTLTASATGGITGETFSYTLLGGPASQSNTTGEFVVSTAGTYTAIIANASGCTSTTTASVESNTASPTNVSLTSGTLTCAQTSVTLTASSTGGTSYTLNDGQTNSTGEFVVSTAGTYTVTASGPNGCTAMATATVESNTTSPMATLLASSPTVCAPASITLTASGGTSYSFSAGATQIGTSNQAIVTQSGSYSVTVSNANGCTATASTSVTVNTPPAVPTLTGISRTVDQSNTPLPLGQFVQATGSNTLSFSGVNGMLNPPTADISQVGVQNFSVSQTDANGCTSPATPFTITVQQSMTTTPGSQTVCRSSRVVLSATTTGTRYEWYKNGTSAPFKLTEIASIQKGTATASLTVVSIQTSASYYCKVFQANGSFSFDGPFVVTVNYGCRIAAMEVVEVPLSVTLTPNPVADGQLRAVVRGAANQALTVELVNLRGEVVRQQVWPSAEAEQLIEWDISHRPSGVYVLQAASGRQSASAKVVKAD